MCYEELYYISKFGISKSVIKVDGKVQKTHFYSEMMPLDNAGYIFYSLAFKFWAKTIDKLIGHRTFRVPYSLVKKPPFDLHYLGTKKKGFSVTYNEDDFLLSRFLKRFTDDGNLSFGREHWWGERLSELRCKKWSAPKGKKKTASPKTQKVSKSKTTSSYIYLIHIHDNLYKIGQSKNPHSRLKTLQTSSPYKLALTHSFQADDVNKAEEMLHRLFADNREMGEWFRLTAKQCDLISKIDVFKDNGFWIDGAKAELEKINSSVFTQGNGLSQTHFLIFNLTFSFQNSRSSAAQDSELGETHHPHTEVVEVDVVVVAAGAAGAALTVV